VKFKFLGDLALLPLYGVVAMFLYWAVQSLYPLSIIHAVEPYYISVEAGDTFSFAYNIEYTRSCPSISTTRKLVPIDVNGKPQGNVSHILEFVDISVTRSDGIESVQRNIYVPRSVPPGKYMYVTTQIYNCNPYDLVFPRSTNVSGPIVTVLPGKHEPERRR